MKCCPHVLFRKLRYYADNRLDTISWAGSKGLGSQWPLLYAERLLFEKNLNNSRSLRVTQRG